MQREEKIVHTCREGNEGREWMGQVEGEGRWKENGEGNRRYLGEGEGAKGKVREGKWKES